MCVGGHIGVSEGPSQGGPTYFIPPNYLSFLLPPLYQYEIILTGKIVSYVINKHDITSIRNKFIL